jgi:hypothetical protein
VRSSIHVVASFQLYIRLSLGLIVGTTGNYPLLSSRHVMAASDGLLAQKRPHVSDKEFPDLQDPVADPKDSKKNRSKGLTFPPLSSTKRQVMLVLEYDGTEFKGWQSQSHQSNKDNSEGLGTASGDAPTYIPGVKSGKRNPGDPVRTVSNSVAMANGGSLLIVSPV